MIESIPALCGMALGGTIVMRTIVQCFYWSTELTPADSADSSAAVYYAVRDVTLLTAALIVVPIVHLFSTWALPLAGILGARNAIKTTKRVSHVTGQCPACKGKLLLAGGRAVFPLRDACEHCSRPLILNLVDT